MNRSLTIGIDSTTWPAPPQLPVFPPTFHRGSRSVQINIPGALLLIGYLTTPSEVRGVSLSEYWAWVRYLHAIAVSQDLRITDAFATLDPHQKTILSDDFGMGIPMYWLIQNLQLSLICGGYYFIERLAASVGASAVRTAKRGPNKSPDFVARDASGTWHVIECKGTQSNSQYRDTQIGTAGIKPSGAIAQKRGIIFPRTHTGQKLACGLIVSVENRPDQSNLKIVDPDAPDNFEVHEDNLLYAEDTALRSVAAKSLRLAGFEATSLVLASPSGPRPSSRPTHGLRERRRRAFLEQRRALALEELAGERPREVLSEGGEQFLGRAVTLDLPQPVIVAERQIRSVTVRQGINARLVNDLTPDHLMDEGMFTEAGTSWREYAQTTKIESYQLSAQLRIGKIFHSEIKLY